MKILTWNILASEWIDNKTYNTVPKSIRCNRTIRLDSILKYIFLHEASVIMLQEVMQQEYNKIVDTLQNLYIISPLVRIHWGINKNNSGNVTLFKKTDFSEKQMKHTSLPFGLQTECLYKNKFVNLFNVHFTDKSSQERYKQLSSIMPLLQEARNCIIGGDFNHQYSSNTRFYNIPNYTIHNTNCPTYYIERKMNIDNILSKGFNKSTIAKCPEYPKDIEKGFLTYGSDHLPISVEVY